MWLCPSSVLCSGTNCDLAPGCSTADAAILPKASLWLRSCSGGPKAASAEPAQLRASVSWPVVFTCLWGDRPGNGVSSCGASRAVHPPCCYFLPLLKPPVQVGSAIHVPLDFPQNMGSAIIFRWDTGFLFKNFLMYSDYLRAGLLLEELGQNVQQNFLCPNILFCFN